jgi:hypothetical protein
MNNPNKQWLILQEMKVGQTGPPLEMKAITTTALEGVQDGLVEYLESNHIHNNLLKVKVT